MMAWCLTTFGVMYLDFNPGETEVFCQQETPLATMHLSHPQ